MSRSMCNRLLALSAAIAVLIVLSYNLVVRPPADRLAAILEIVGSSLLMWTAVAAVLGMLAESILLLTGRGQRADRGRRGEPRHPDWWSSSCSPSSLRWAVS